MAAGCTIPARGDVVRRKRQAHTAEPRPIPAERSAGGRTPASSAHPAEGIHELHRMIGNRAVGAILRAPTKPSVKAFSAKWKLVKGLEKAARDDDRTKAQTNANALHGSDPVFYRKLLKYKLTKHAGNQAKRQIYLQGPSITALKEAIATQDAELVNLLKSGIGFLSKDDLVALAKQVPDFFLDNVLVPLQKDPSLARQFKELLLDNYFDPSQKQLGGQTAQDTRSEGMRAELRTALGPKWVAFAKTIPVLAVAEEAAEHFATQKDAPSEVEIVDHVFDSFVANRGINIGYYTVSKDPSEKITMGTGGAPQVTGDLSGAPEVLRTQCDDIMKILREAVRAYPNLKVNFTIGMEKQALLTKPLDTQPGGLIPKTAEGNVQDSKGNWTKQIFFTGVTESKNPNSHTWLVINGKPYDAVLGTKGAQVAASQDSAFTQTHEGTDDEKGWKTEWTNAAGDRLVKLTNVQAPKNAMGFGTAYKLIRAGEKQA